MQFGFTAINKCVRNVISVSGRSAECHFSSLMNYGCADLFERIRCDDRVFNSMIDE